MDIREGNLALTWADKIHSITEWRNVLYLGLHAKTFHEWKGYWFLQHIHRYRSDAHTVCVERHLPYIERSRKSPFIQDFDIAFCHSDWHSFLIAAGNNSKDAVMLWHGPEHVKEEELMGLLEQAERVSRGVVILGCPADDDPYVDAESDDRHHAIIRRADLEALGYETITIPRPTNPRGVAALCAIRDCR